LASKMNVSTFTAPTGLPKETRSLCPECGKVIKATILAEDGKAMMVKECAERSSRPRSSRRTARP